MSQRPQDCSVLEQQNVPSGLSLRLWAEASSPSFRKEQRRGSTTVYFGVAGTNFTSSTSRCAPRVALYAPLVKMSIAGMGVLKVVLMISSPRPSAILPLIKEPVTCVPD